MALLGLLLGKLLIYCAFFLWVPRLLGFRVADPAGFALRWGAVRLAMGLLGIIPAFLAASALAWTAASSGVLFYVALYVIRALIWAGLAVAIWRSHSFKRPIPWTGWIALGLMLNLLLDIAIHAAGLDDFKYVC